MCVVSAIGDYWKDRIPDKHPWVEPYIHPQYPYNPDPNFVPKETYISTPGPTREEFEALKKEVLELRELLKAAQKYDAETNQPHCEHEDKVAIIKKVAELVGVDLKDVLK